MTMKKTMKKKMMMTDKSDAVIIALLSVIAITSIIANFMLHVPFSLMTLPLIGIIAYCVYIRLGDYDTSVICDYIQTGEAAVGSIVLFATLVFISENQHIVLLLVFLALLIYELYLKAAIAPEKKEQSINGSVTQTILFIIVAFIIAAGAGLRISRPEAILFGYFPSFGNSFAIPASALFLAALAFFLPWAFKQELRLYYLGPPFCEYAGPVRAGIATAIIIARSILLTITIFFAGWTCGIGISIRRLYPSRLADAILLLSLICFWQIITLLANLAGPWYAAALMLAASYAIFIPYFKKRVYLYDRYQQS
jgi:hypothetical protein